jgi:hypothetical protein
METMKLSTFVANASEPYAWPGGYPRYLITHDGAALCFTCVQSERRLLRNACRNPQAYHGWVPAAFEINWEDVDLTCDHCGKHIESAYGETR